MPHSKVIKKSNSKPELNNEAQIELAIRTHQTGSMQMQISSRLEAAPTTNNQ